MGISTDGILAYGLDFGELKRYHYELRQLMRGTGVYSPGGVG